MIISLNLRQVAFRLLVIAAVLIAVAAEHQFAPLAPAVTSDDGIRIGNANKNTVALMINVDWGEEFIPGMLDVLEQKHAKVTFFVVGRWAKKNPELLQRMAAEGHQIASHGASHKLCTKLPDNELDGLIQDGINILREITGNDPAPVFAPPSGDSDARVVAAAQRYGVKTILWTLDTVDWKLPPPETIISRAVNKASPGALVLMHPTKPSLQALPGIIDGLRRKGLEPAVVTDVIAP